MAVIKVARTKNIYGAQRYNTGRDGDRPAVPVVCVGPGAENPMVWAQRAQEMAKNARGRAKNRAHLFVLSFSPAELDASDPAAQLLAQRIAQDYVARTAPNSPYSLTVHADKSHLHVHGIIANVDMESNAPLGSDVSHWSAARKRNDQVLREWGMDVLGDARDPVRLTKQEVQATRRGEDISAVDDHGQERPISAATASAILRNRILNLYADQRCVSADEMAAVAPEYGVSMRITEGKKSGVSWALIDEHGDTETYAVPSGKTYKAAAAGKKLGDHFTLAEVESQAQQRAGEAAQSRQAQMARATAHAIQDALREQVEELLAEDALSEQQKFIHEMEEDHNAIARSNAGNTDQETTGGAGTGDGDEYAATINTGDGAVGSGAGGPIKQRDADGVRPGAARGGTRRAQIADGDERGSVAAAGGRGEGTGVDRGPSAGAGDGPAGGGSSSRRGGGNAADHPAAHRDERRASATDRDRGNRRAKYDEPEFG